MDEEELNKMVQLEIEEHANGTSSSTGNDRKRKKVDDSSESYKKIKLPKDQRKEQKHQKKEMEVTRAKAMLNGGLDEEDSRIAKKTEKKRLRALVKAGSEDDRPEANGHDKSSQMSGNAIAKDLKAARKAERRLKAIQLAQSQEDDQDGLELHDTRSETIVAISSRDSIIVHGDKTARRAKKKAEKLHPKTSRKSSSQKVAKDHIRDGPDDEEEKMSLDDGEPDLVGESLDLRHGAMKKAEKEKNIVSAKMLTNGSNESCKHPILDTSNSRKSPELSALNQGEIDSFLLSNSITVSDPSTSAPLRPMSSFSHLPPSTVTFTSTLSSFKSPTPIQSAVWPFLFAGRDVIGVAETGSGKTLAFGVPCIDYINSLTGSSTTPQSKKFVGRAKAVIVSPTRELALQSYEQLSVLGRDVNIQTVCVYGGVSKDPQKLALQSADIIVATPGRLIDLMNEGAADLSKVGYLVLDEADRMLDKGFENDIRKIISAMPSTLPASLSKEGSAVDRPRQTLMFTATWPPSIRDLAATFLLNPVHISIGLDNPQGDLRANTRIMQIVEVVDPRSKETRLMQILKKNQSGISKDDRILIFCLYKKEAQRVENSLRTKGLRVVGIHGDLSQEKRTNSLMEFKREGGTPLLVATDVAARGLDIPNVKLVINLTFPLTVEDYVHRIGR